MTSSNYEFSATESKPIRLIARVTLVVAILLLALALLRFVQLVETGILLESGQMVFNYSDNIIELLSVYLPIIVLFVGCYQFYQSSRSFHSIVDTSGRDIWLLRMAMGSLANGFILFAIFMILNIFRWAVWVDEIQRCLSAIR